MRRTYIDLFSIDNLLITNNHQDIFMGTSKDIAKDKVFINILKNKNILLSNSKKKIKNSLRNFLHLEEIDNKLVLVTKLSAGYSLSQYLSQNNVDKNSRRQLIFQYLKEISKYKTLSNSLINNLIDESQIFIKDNTLHFSELIKNDDMLQSKIEFDSVIKKIGAISRKIYTYELSETYLDNPVNDSILRFIDDLENNRLPFNNMDDIFDYYKSLYFSRLVSKTNNKYVQNVLAKSRRKKRTRRLLFKIVIGCLIGGLTAYAATNFDFQHISEKQESFTQPPTAYFNKINVENGWKFINKSTADGDNNDIIKSVWKVYKNNQLVEKRSSYDLNMNSIESGNYKIVLKVQDRHEKWSTSYEKKFDMDKIKSSELSKEIAKDTNTSEELDKYKITYNDTNTILVDDATLRSGKYSIRFDTNETGSPQTIIIKDLKPYDYSYFSMWIMSNTIQSVDFQLEGYKDGHKNYHNTFSFKPVMSNYWVMFNMNDDFSNINELRITVLNHDTPLWIDDLSIDIYK